MFLGDYRCIWHITNPIHTEGVSTSATKFRFSDISNIRARKRREKSLGTQKSIKYFSVFTQYFLKV